MSLIEFFISEIKKVFREITSLYARLTTTVNIFRMVSVVKLLCSHSRHTLTKTSFRTKLTY